MKRICCVIILAWGLISCSTGDDGVEEIDTQEVNFPAFAGLSYGSEALYEYRFRESDQTGDFTNLSQQEGIPNEFNFTHQQRGAFGLYRQQDVYLIDLRKQTRETFRDYVSPGNSEQREAVVNDDLHIVLLYRESETPENLELRIINTQNNVQSQANFGAVDGLGRIYLFDQTIIVTLQDTTENTTTLYVIDLPTGSIEQSFDIENTALITAVAFGDQNDFYFFDGNGRYYRYDLKALLLLEERPCDFSLNLDITYEIEDQRIISYYNYAQPSFLERGPELFDLRTNTALRVDIEPAYREFISTDSTYTQITTTNFAYDRLSERWLTNFTAETTNGDLLHGVFLISQEGELLDQMDLVRPLRYIVSLN